MPSKSTKAPQAEATEPKYSKAALLASKKFEARKDLLSVILADGESYTIGEVETAIKNYINKEV